MSGGTLDATEEPAKRTRVLNGVAVGGGDLADCDVLDLDCEDGELEILRALECRPRLLTVEAHPHLGCSHDAVETELARLGYDVATAEPIEADDDIVNYVALRDAA